MTDPVKQHEAVAIDLLQTLGLATWNEETQTDDVDSSQVTDVLAAIDSARHTCWNCGSKVPRLPEDIARGQVNTDAVVRGEPSPNPYEVGVRGSAFVPPGGLCDCAHATNHALPHTPGCPGYRAPSPAEEAAWDKAFSRVYKGLAFTERERMAFSNGWAEPAAKAFELKIQLEEADEQFERVCSRLMAAELPRRWTACGDELPDSDVWVVAAKDERHFVVAQLEFTDDSEGNGKPYWSWRGGSAPLGDYPHWIPIPALSVPDPKPEQG